MCSEINNRISSLVATVSVFTHTQVMQQFLRSVLCWFEVEELLVLVDELGVHGGVEELVVGQNILKERDVGLEMEMERKSQIVYDLSHLAHKLIICTLQSNTDRVKSAAIVDANSEIKRFKVQ